MLKTMKRFSSLTLLSLLALCGCDPQKEALKIFTEQGLTVLKPARDYIALGGIFVIPKNGTSVYLDPYDTLPSANGGATPFRAIVMQQSANSSVGFDLAVGTLGGLVPIPAGLKFAHAKDVQLAQIDASGTRYTSQMMAALVKMQATNDAIKTRLTGNRVFLVQELYTGKSLALKSSAGDSLAVAVEGAATIPDCSSASGSASPDLKSSPSPTPTPTSSPSPAAKGNATKAASSPTTKSSTSSTPEKPPSPGTSTSNNVGVSVGVCWSNGATLSFQSDTAIPFAVRLNEVVLGPGGTLQIKDTNFKLKNTALGGPDESATAVINPTDPVLQDFTHPSH